MNGPRTLEARDQNSRDAEIARLKREIEVLRERERHARAEAQGVRKRFSELTAISKGFASSMRARVRERQQYRRRLAAQLAVSGVLAEARDLQEATPRIFEVLGEGLGWQLGILWTLDEQASVLRRAGIWRSSTSSPGAMEEACEDMSLRPGESLPGRVWKRQAPVWVENVLEDGNFLRKEAAGADGLHGALAFPIRNGGQVGVFEFFHREILPPDEDLLRTAILICHQIEQFLERRRVEQEREKLLLRERAARSEAEATRRETASILESITDAFFAFDGDWRYRYVNWAASEVVRDTGRDPESILGKVLWEEYPELEGTELEAGLLRAARERETVELEWFYPLLEVWFHVRVYPSGDEGVSVYLEDVTERKRAEERLVASERRFRRVLEIDTVGVIFFDEEGNITDTNDGFLRMSGFEREDVERRLMSWQQMTPTEWMECSEQAFEELRETGKTTPYEKEYFRKDGSRWWGLFAATLLDGGDGVEFVIDVTERRKVEGERERFLEREWRARAEAEERKRISRELHDRVAHSIGVVHQSLELYEAFKERNPEQAEAKMRLARETTREALDTTRNLSRELQEMEAKHGLSEALSNLLKTTVPPGIRSGMRVDGDESFVPPRVREQLFLIMREAVRNAVSHAGAKQLKVEVKTGSDRVLGRVEDDGRGFEEVSDGDDGPGRGIDSMRERAELVGGTFRLSSAPGKGTKVEACIPLNARTEEERAKQTVAESAGE